MKEKKGISLIVLIVTIIVMIIIAGAVIISLTETNIIDQAETAVEKHNLSELKSAANMAYANWLLSDKTLDPQNYIRDELIKQKVATWDDFSKYYITETGGIEEIDQEAFTFIVDIKDVQTDILYITGDDWQGFDEMAIVDWGDNSGSEEAIGYLQHEYAKPGKYEVKITGPISLLDLAGIQQDGKSIIAIKSFGNIGYEQLMMYQMKSLKYISMPNQESFKNLDAFCLTEAPIQELPDYMLKGSKVTDIQASFMDCTNLRFIPDHLFEGLELTNTSLAFYNCSSLTGNAPEWWNDSNITKYEHCFYNCTNLQNYDSIPESWKQQR